MAVTAEGGWQGLADAARGRRGRGCGRRVAAGLAAVLATWSVPRGAAAASATVTRLIPPVARACVSSPFGPRILPGRPKADGFHRGIDLPAPAGAAVTAVAPGQILQVHRRGPGGLEVLVQHPGFIGVYSHLGRVTPAIANGRRRLASGQEIGVVGHSGLTYGMHLYFGMLIAGRPVDPAPYLRLQRCG